MAGLTRTLCGRAAAFIALTAVLAVPEARAHGIWGHVHVTGWAVENMPQGDELRELLLEPEVFNALLFGAAFTDSGYAAPGEASRAYSEHTHWEPFIEDFVAWIRANDPPPFETLESRKRVAFLLGCASHGLQDEIFDTLFLSHVEEHDGQGQEQTDPGTDGFLVLDEHIRFVPEQDIPMDTLLELYQALDQEVTEEVILGAVGLMTGFYVNDGPGLEIARGLGEDLAPQMPWTRVHYLDPEVPGSLRAEIFPTMRYQQAVWRRLHAELPADAATVFAFPEAPRRLLSGDPLSASSWASLVFGVGVRYEPDMLGLVDAGGALVPTTQANTRWNAEFTRVIRLAPVDPLAPGGWYTLRLRSGLEPIDGRSSPSAFELTFQVACEEGDGACEDLGELPVADIDGVPDAPAEPGATPDATDAGCGCSGAPGSAGFGPGLVALLALGALPIRRRPPLPDHLKLTVPDGST